MHRNLDRFGPHGGVIPYSCMDAITVMRKSLKDVAGYKDVGLTKSLRLLVLRLELCSTLLTVSTLALCSSFLVSFVLFFRMAPRCGWSVLSLFCVADYFKYSPVTTCPERKGGGSSSETP